MTPAIRNVGNIRHLPASWLKEPADGDITEFKTEHGYTQRASAKLSEIYVATKQKHGGDRKSENAEIKVDNVNLDDQPDGNSKHAGLRRLRKDRPDLDLAEADGTVSHQTVKNAVSTVKDLTVDLPQTVTGKEARP